MIYLKRFFSVAALFLIAALILNSCAAIFKGKNETVDFSSSPTKAKVYINGQLAGETPLQIRLDATETYNVSFKKEGYEERSIILTNSVGAGWVILDVIFGLLPVVVDAATGSWYSFEYDYYNAVLEQYK